MPLLFRKSIETGGEIGVWDASEPEDELLRLWDPTAQERSALEKVRHSARRREIMAVRILLRRLHNTPGATPAIGYDPFGKPFLVNRPEHITISHSKQRVGVMIHPDALPGLDIEMIDERIFRIAPKFLSAGEEVHLRDRDPLLKLHLVWAAKEVVYKIHGKRGVDFKTQLTVHPFALNHGDAVRKITVDFCVNERVRQYTLTSMLMPGMVAVYGTERESTEQQTSKP